MANFLEYIEEDVQSKKTLFSTMPTKTKTNKKKYNEKVEEIRAKYIDYKVAVKKYIDLKSKSFNVPDRRNLEELTKRAADFENIRFILNPANTYVEKIGFDTLFFQMNNHSEISFEKVNEIIAAFIDKFESAGIVLSASDFDYTCYVNEFMTAFFKKRIARDSNAGLLTATFESVYWENPDIISHIELNFRRLVLANEKKLVEYISKLQKNIMTTNKITYESCLDKIEEVYEEFSEIERENISDIIAKAKSGEIEINNYFEDSKIRNATFSSLMLTPIDLNNEKAMNKFYDSLDKLRINLNEYGNYLKFTPLIIDFSNRFLKSIGNVKDLNRNLKAIQSKINQTESKLNKINKKLNGGSSIIFKTKDFEVKGLKLESIQVANELVLLYKSYNEEYFKVKVASVVSETFTVTDLLNLYYSYDFYKREALKRVFNLTSYEELDEYSDTFDLFAMNPSNVIVCSVKAYNESSVAEIIVGKYRLLNINISLDELLNEDVSAMLDKINMVLRIREIKENKTTVEKIWFMAQVEKFTEKDKKKN